MNSVNVNLHDYYNKFVNLYNYTLTDVGHFQEKLCKFYIYFYYTPTDVSALNAFNQIKFDFSIGLKKV